MSQTFLIKDEAGNIIESVHKGSKASLRLKLSSENYFRQIGSIDMKTRQLEMVRERSKHLFRKFNAYGFNHHILNNAILFDHVLIKDDKGLYNVPKEVILEKGKFMNFKNHGGFELQIFLPLNEIENYQITSPL
jgi:hypothetical protein